MKVKELIKVLQGYGPDREEWEVVLLSVDIDDEDGETREYEKVASAKPMKIIFAPHRTHAVGKVYQQGIELDDPQLRCDPRNDTPHQEGLKKAVDCVVLNH